MEMAKWILTLQWQDDLWGVSKQEEMRTKKKEKKRWTKHEDINWYSKIWEDLALQQHYRLFVQLESGTLCNTYPSVFPPSPFSPLFVSSPNSVIFFKTLFHLFCLCWFFWLSINMQCEHWRPARCHKCYWLAYHTEKRAAVIKCHWPQKMYHPPFSLLPPLSFPIPIYLFIYLLYLIFDFNFIVIFYLITSRLGESQARSAAMWQPDVTWHDGTGHNMTWQSTFES